MDVSIELSSQVDPSTPLKQEFDASNSSYPVHAQKHKIYPKSLFGLKIEHYHYEDVQLPDVETFSTLYDLALKSLDETRRVALTSSRLSSVKDQAAKLFAELEGYIREMVNIAALKHAVYSKLPNYNYNTIDHFRFENRGTMLTLLHYFNEMKRNIRTGGVFPKIFIAKLAVHTLIIKFANVMVKDLANYYGSAPFNDGYSIDAYEELDNLNIAPFLYEIGYQVSSGFRMALTVFVKVAASFATLKPLYSVNDLLYFPTFGTVTSYFLTKPYHAAEVAKQFYKKVDPMDGKHLWEISDRVLPLLGSYYINVSVPVAENFTIPSFTQEQVQKDFDRSIQYWQKFVQDNSAKDSSLNPVNDTVPSIIGMDPLFASAPQIQINVDEFMLKGKIKPDNSVKPLEIDYDRAATLQETLNQAQKYPKLLSNYNESTISLRLISMYAPKTVETKPDFPFFYEFAKFISAPFERKTRQPHDGTLMFHIHGGGFVAMSPFSHESYLRRWAHDTHIPIISVDYRKSPEYMWPVLPEECYQAYKWVVNNAERFLPDGQKLRKIIVGGDSAGGNLTMAVALRAIFDNFRIPDLLIITYPAANVTVIPSTARLNALSEALVNYSFLKMCFYAYIPKEAQDSAAVDPFISPGSAPAEFLKKFPPCYINAGALDPLFDDAVNAAKQIAKYNGNQVFFQVFDGLSHGYLNMCYEPIFPDCLAAVNEISKFINKFLEAAADDD